jgi:hypothetical protein
MGTNYYVAENACDCCNRYDEAYHIGKASHGWAFSFRGYRPERLVSWAAWREFLKDKAIRDEYGERVDYDWFVNYIETQKAPGWVRPENGRPNLVHNEEGRKPNKSGFSWFDPEYDWDDDQGYSFCSREFS